ncbi:Protein glass [Frankliniella fusca]|uniref:Protein glass n=1 Tax=Frankliniella fusca TaxID=407009 RepID=A0AAE1HLI7_9NEOP|nr:Protein glass [Frankliniella fusca]
MKHLNSGKALLDKHFHLIHLVPVQSAALITTTTDDDDDDTSAQNEDSEEHDSTDADNEEDEEDDDDDDKTKCQLCGFKAKTKYAMKKHIENHRVENRCGKGFVQKSNVKRHMVTHTHVKKFQCSNCRRRFSTSSNMKRHMQRCM